MAIMPSAIRWVGWCQGGAKSQTSRDSMSDTSWQKMAAGYGQDFVIPMARLSGGCGHIASRTCISMVRYRPDWLSCTFARTIGASILPISGLLPMARIVVMIGLVFAIENVSVATPCRGTTSPVTGTFGFARYALGADRGHGWRHIQAGSRVITASGTRSDKSGLRLGRRRSKQPVATAIPGWRIIGTSARLAGSHA